MPIAKLKHFHVHHDNSKEYHILKREIFGSHTYYVELEKPDPLIIDAGAHIGLTTLYFKDLYPQSHIIAIEPQPRSFQLLEQNIWENHLENVDAHLVALSDSDASIQLYSDATPDKWYSTTSVQPGAWNNSQLDQKPLTAVALPLSHFLNQPVDLLKMDIEGHEMPVLRASQDKLKQIQHIILEFHPVNNSTWQECAQLLENLGFQVTASKHGQTLSPKKPVTGLVLIEALQSK